MSAWGCVPRYARDEFWKIRFRNRSRTAAYGQMKARKAVPLFFRSITHKSVFKTCGNGVMVCDVIPEFLKVQKPRKATKRNLI